MTKEVRNNASHDGQRLNFVLKYDLGEVTERNFTFCEISMLGCLRKIA